MKLSPPGTVDSRVEAQSQSQSEGSPQQGEPRAQAQHGSRLTSPWDALPRRHYFDSPTPLEPLARLSGALGADVWVKRDDLTGLGGGGNKVRKLEFLVGDALDRGATTLVTTGAVQSNHCRLTAAAAAREGLACRLVLEEHLPGTWSPKAPGNPLLDDLFGVTDPLIVPPGTDCDAAMAALASRLDRPYVISSGGSTPVGAVGYAAMVPELGDGFDLIVVPTGSGGTQAGILVGLAAVGSDTPVLGISDGRPKKAQERIIYDLAVATAELLGVTPPARDAVVVDDGYIGPGYAVATAEMADAVRMVASLEGLLLDPVYTGKAMAGLIDLVRTGHIRGRVCFVHTGGSPALHAYAEAF